MVGRSIVQTLIESDLTSKFKAYFLVGGLCALVDFLLFGVFLEFGAHYLLAASISFVLATALNFVLSIRYVFPDGGRPRHHELVLVYIASAIGISVNLAVLAVSVELIGLHPLIGKVAGTGAAFGWNFSSRYFWIFRPAAPELAAPESRQRHIDD